MKNKLGKQLKEIREYNNLSQRKLANDLGVTQACIGKWETGDREPSLDDLIKVAKYFGVTTDYMLGLED